MKKNDRPKFVLCRETIVILEEQRFADIRIAGGKSKTIGHSDALCTGNCETTCLCPP